MTGVVIAGGRSSRMDHREKALLDLAGEPMLGRVIDRLRPQVGRMVINANGDPKRFAQFGLPIVADAIEGHEGPLAGLHAGLQWARAETPDARFIASVAADTPFIPDDLVARLLAALEQAGASSAIASSGGEWTPVVGVWSVALSDTLAEALRQGVRAVHRFATAQDSSVVEFPFVEIGGERIDPFFNVNTPEDLDRARALLAAEQARG
ncbi:MAG: molybdenum cofactor guanylyltransferase MobA [Hyphomicrobium sp.]